MLGALGFGAAAWKVAARDRWIGWDASVREARLGRVLNNARFLLLPWVRVKNLASKVLALSARQVADDFAARYGERPVLLETFVEIPRAFAAAATGRPTGGIWARPPAGARATAPIGRSCRARASTSTP